MTFYYAYGNGDSGHPRSGFPASLARTATDRRIGHADLSQGQEAVVFALLSLAKQLAEKQAAVTSSDPSTPSGHPPYAKPPANRRAKQAQGGQARTSWQSSPDAATDRRSPGSHAPLQACPKGHGPLKRCRSSRTRIIEDIPADITPVVTEHTISGYWCPGCRATVEPVVTDALLGSTLGLQVVVLSAWLHTMRKIIYSVAMSLDGSIAGPNGAAGWIVIDPEIDFPNRMARFDTVLMGRRTFEAAPTQSGGGEIAGITSVVVSGTLRPADYSGVTVLSEDVGAAVSRLRVQPGKDIWLFGGGSLFRSLLDLGLVDTVEVAIVPVLLGGGIPLLPPGSERSSLRLVSSKVYKATGAVSLEYSVEQQQAEPDAAPAPVAQGGSGSS